MQTRLPLNRPTNRAQDLAAKVFEDVDVLINDLIVDCTRRGSPVIEGRTFRGCRIAGPAVIVVTGNTTFDDTDFGDPQGDPRNLVLRPVGDAVVGAIPIRNCVFDGCEFYNVGFTGPETFLTQLLDLTPRGDTA